MKTILKISMLMWFLTTTPASGQTVSEGNRMTTNTVTHAAELSKTELWIDRAKAVHGDRYQYEKTVFVRALDKLIITCRVHGDFKVVPSSHLLGINCLDCSRVSRARNRIANKFKGWLQDCTEFHGGIYDYSKVVYRGCKEHVEIQCPTHGSFFQSPDAHRRGGCLHCADITRTETVNAPRIKAAAERFINQAPVVHGGKYDYSKVDYKGDHVKVEIICPDHGSFFQRAYGHLSGKGCSKCARNNTDHAAETFVQLSNEMHNHKYDYSLVDYLNCETSVEIICPQHASFHQSPIAHKRGQGCPYCKDSHGEREIAKCLESMGIKFERQKRFDTCRDKRKLAFDFFIPATDLFLRNTLIEYDGRQHEIAVDFFGGQKGLEDRQRRDAIKTKWAKDHGYDLIRIPYVAFDDITGIISSVRV